MVEGYTPFSYGWDKINISTSKNSIVSSEILIIGGSPIGDPIVRMVLL
jgi:hypothetical protein